MTEKQTQECQNDICCVASANERQEEGEEEKPAEGLQRLRRRICHKLKADLNYTMRVCLKNNNNKKPQIQKN